LLAAEGLENKQVADQLNINRHTARKWRNRFAEQRLDGLNDLPRPGKPKTFTVEDELHFLKTVLSEPPEPYTHWSLSLLEKHTSFSKTSAHKLLKKLDIQPHRFQTFKYSNDPELEEKVVDIAGLYLKPPEKAFVISFDEKTQIQALDRTQTKLPLKPGSPERRTHDYVRHGTTNLFAALNIVTGEVIGECKPKHTAKDVLAFLKQIRKAWPYRTLHIIADNLSAHKAQIVKEWVEKNKRVHIHFTPTSASWMNQIEIWFSIIQRQMLKRGRYESVDELIEKIGKFIANWNQTKRPFVWKKTAEEILEKAKPNKATN